MIKHVLITFLRDLFKNRLTSFINLLGLALALGSSFLILLYILHETSYNKFHKEKNRICRVLTEYNWLEGDFETSSSTSLLMADVLAAEYPEVEQAARVCNYELFYGGQYVKKGEQYIHEVNFQVVDPSFFRIFSYQIIKGDKNHLLDDPYDLVISESTASKYFGEDNPVGKTLTIRNYEGEREYTVRGVYRDIPSWSTFQADLIGNIELTYSFYGDRGWGQSNIQTYVLLKDELSIGSLGTKLKTFYQEKHPDRKAYYHLQPLKEIHFHSDHLLWYQLPQGNLKRIYLLAVIALLILLIPCINYVILTTARGMNRYIEIGIKKVVGATRRSVFIHVTAESVLFLVLSLPFAVMVSEIMLPTFNRLMGMQLEIDYFNNWKYLSGLFLITLLFGLLSGIYISMFLSRFQPEDILKLRFTSRYGSKLFRRILIILQLSIFLVLFIFTSIQYKQLKYIEKSGQGFKPDNVLAIVPPHDHHLYSCKAYKDAITSIPGIESVSEVFAGLFTAVVWWNNYTPQDNADANINFRRLAGDADFIKTFGFNILEGRGFSADLATDSGKILINETGAAELGLIDPVGQWVTAMKGDRFEIIGVVSDFNIGSLHEKIPPVAITIRPEESMVCQVAVCINRSASARRVMSALSDKWDEFGPGGRFEYFWMDEKFSTQYEDDRRFARTFGLFTILTIVVACLGLFGFSLVSSIQRTKEVGIRKTFGATTNQIVKLILKEYFLVIVLANLISWPLGWYFSKIWLQNYAYQTDIGWVIFVVAALVSGLVLMITIGYNTRRLAENNPVESLKYE